MPLDGECQSIPNKSKWCRKYRNKAEGTTHVFVYFHKATANAHQRTKSGEKLTRYATEDSLGMIKIPSMSGCMYMSVYMCVCMCNFTSNFDVGHESNLM